MISMTACRRSFLVVALSCGSALAARRAGAQREATRVGGLVAGCWRLEPGSFVTLHGVPADPGQAVLPSVLSFDTVPGMSWNNRRVGQRVRSLRDTTVTRYRTGYYRFVPPESVLVDWTNGFVGLSLELQVDSLTMSGRATVWTDYGGSQRADVTLRRTVCP